MTDTFSNSSICQGLGMAIQIMISVNLLDCFCSTDISNDKMEV